MQLGVQTTGIAHSQVTAVLGLPPERGLMGATVAADTGWSLGSRSWLGLHGGLVTQDGSLLEQR